MKMKKITDEELRKMLAVGDGEETVILTMSGGSLYEEYEEIRVGRLDYNNVLKCHVHRLGDIEWYLHETFLAYADPGDCILEDKEVMKRAVDLIEQGWED